MTQTAPGGNRRDRIEQALRLAFGPSALEVRDESALHAGHAGAAPGGQTHFAVWMVSRRFSGLSRVARQRAVNETLADEFASGLHALSLHLEPPEA